MLVTQNMKTYLTFKGELSKLSATFIVALPTTTGKLQTVLAVLINKKRNDWK